MWCCCAVVTLPGQTVVLAHNQAEAELEALRSELQQQQQELSKRAEALAAAAKEGAAQVRPNTLAGSGLVFSTPTRAFCTGHSKSNTHQCRLAPKSALPESFIVGCCVVAAGCLD